MDSLELPNDVSAALDQWIAEQPDPKPSRVEAITLALVDWLLVMGRLPADEPVKKPVGIYKPVEGP